MCLITNTERTAQVFKFIGYCTIIALIVCAICAKLADSETEIGDHDWIIDVTVLIESPDCMTGGALFDYDFRSIFGKYPDCREWFVGDPGECFNADEKSSTTRSIPRRL